MDTKTNSLGYAVPYDVAPRLTLTDQLATLSSLIDDVDKTTRCIESRIQGDIPQVPSQMPPESNYVGIQGTVEHLDRQLRGIHAMLSDNLSRL